ncbi:hypothetical protein C8R46DRAFT_1026257 [Mycena filopes]|nr:hypothetical protein C8R46DRAFT_1026257 [Mycena filopes]
MQNPLRSRVIATGEEVFRVPPHWHRYQTEEHVILKGRVKLTQGGVTRVLTPADGPVLTVPGVVHGFEGFLGEEMIMDEISTPAPDAEEQKILFFRNLFAPGVMPTTPGGRPSVLRVLQIFYFGDTYPALPLGRSFDQLVVLVVGGWIAPLFGYKLSDDRLRMDPKRFPNKKTD